MIDSYFIRGYLFYEFLEYLIFFYFCLNKFFFIIRCVSVYIYGVIMCCVCSLIVL